MEPCMEQPCIRVSKKSYHKTQLPMNIVGQSPKQKDIKNIKNTKSKAKTNLYFFLRYPLLRRGTNNDGVPW